MKYAKPVAAGAAAAAAGAAAGGAAVYGANKLTEAEQKERIKQLLYAYAPYVGGGLALGSVLGGLVGSRYDNTLVGGLVGGLGGAALGGAGKYAYDKYRARMQA
jgi:hypothetical protein